MTRARFSAATAAILSVMCGSAQAGTLEVKIDTAGTEGTLRAAVYDSQASFDGQKLVSGSMSPVKDGSGRVVFDGLEPGVYGIAVFLDLNGNNALDRNLFGAPTEPYGFSMNPALGFAAPKFNAFQFDHDGSDQQLTIELFGL